ncbi:MAG: hypothetical protein ACLR2D_09340 [Anaerobutyricum hallii]
MSANYLSAYVMNEAGLETSPYQKFFIKTPQEASCTYGNGML